MYQRKAHQRNNALDTNITSRRICPCRLYFQSYTLAIFRLICSFLQIPGSVRKITTLQRHVSNGEIKA